MPPTKRSKWNQAKFLFEAIIRDKAMFLLGWVLLAKEYLINS